MLMNGNTVEIRSKNVSPKVFCAEYPGRIYAVAGLQAKSGATAENSVAIGRGPRL